VRHAAWFWLAEPVQYVVTAVVGPQVPAQLQPSLRPVPLVHEFWFD
jgi:hypothetical protein